MLLFNCLSTWLLGSRPPPMGSTHNSERSGDRFAAAAHAYHAAAMGIPLLHSRNLVLHTVPTHMCMMLFCACCSCDSSGYPLPPSRRAVCAGDNINCVVLSTAVTAPAIPTAPGVATIGETVAAAISCNLPLMRGEVLIAGVQPPLRSPLML